MAILSEIRRLAVERGLSHHYWHICRGLLAGLKGAPGERERERGREKQRQSGKRASRQGR